MRGWTQVSAQRLARCAASPEREEHWRARLAEVRAVGQDRSS